MTINKIHTDRVLSLTGISLADYVINPYRGCVFGCTYCYSKNNKNMSARRREWGSFIDIKVNSVEILKEELKRIPDKNIRILLGSITEPFQPAEEQYRLTTRILEVLREENIPVLILTKSCLITSCLDLLGYSDKNTVYLTYNSPLVRDLFEHQTPDYPGRLQAMKDIINKNIKLTVYISPFFPFLSDHKQILDELSCLLPDKVRINIEGYNLVMGNWPEIKVKLPGRILDQYKAVYHDLKSYNEYWQKVRAEIDGINREKGYDIRFLIYPYNDYYRNEFN